MISKNLQKGYIIEIEVYDEAGNFVRTEEIEVTTKMIRALIGDEEYEVAIIFFNHKKLKFIAKYLKKLLSYGSSQLQYTTLFLKCTL